MSLYDGLLDSSSSEKTAAQSDRDGSSEKPELGKVSGWSSSYKFMSSQLQRKKATSTKLTQVVKSNRATALAPVASLRPKPAGEMPPPSFEDILPTPQPEQFIMPPPPADITLPPPAKIVPPAHAMTTSESSDAFQSSSQDTPYPPIADEYNPLKPNDYIKLKRERDRRQRQREAEEERERKSKEELEGEPLDLCVEPASKLQSELGRNLLGKAPKGNSVASAIMAKYGYKEGQGLGKSEQGISTALAVEKTSKRGGKIIAPVVGGVPVPTTDAEDFPMDAMPPPAFVDLNEQSKVVLLRNMVGPGEVDDDLQPEVAEECSKYGDVEKCLIYEIPDCPDHEEAVRIFVRFMRVESAVKAVADLNGRFFGGRTVKAGYFSEDRFENLDLAPP